MSSRGKKLNRRQAMVGAGTFGIGASALAAPAVAQSAPTVIRMATSWPQGLGGLADSAQRVADRINTISGGEIAVEVNWAGTLVGALAVHDAAASGEIDMYHSCEYYFQGKHRGMNFFTTVPLGLTGLEQMGWIRHGGGQALWDELNAEFGVKSFAAGSTGVQMGGWFAKEINSVDDLKGLTMRIPGLGGQVLTALGANTVVLPGGGIVEALFDGSIDATEWVGPYNDLHFGFQKLLSSYVYPGFHEPGTMASVGFNKGFWDRLPQEHKSLIEMVCDAELTSHTADYYGNNGIALAQLLNENGVQPTRLPDEVWRQISEVAIDVAASVAEDDAMGRKIYESWAIYRDLMNGSAPVSQSAYLAKRGAEDLFVEV
ncbi:MAG: TRAP transporter substrate-binding protein [Pseudomonadota bacterium]